MVPPFITDVVECFVFDLSFGAWHPTWDAAFWRVNSEVHLKGAIQNLTWAAVSQKVVHAYQTA